MKNLIIAMISLGLLASPSVAQDAIGHATSVVPQAEGSLGKRTLSKNAPVHAQETIQTGDVGKADLQFKDDSNLSVGSKSKVRLDKFVFDPDKSAGTVTVQATRGTFRFVTGKQGTDYKMKTPYGVIGIRG